MQSFIAGLGIGGLIGCVFYIGILVGRINHIRMP
jgi:hypothetical protein